MNRYRKKPIVIEAFQLTESRGKDQSEWPEWLRTAWIKGVDEPGTLCFDSSSRRFFIVTLEGHHVVTWGDWIIQGVKGELYPCKPDIFDASYEVAD